MNTDINDIKRFINKRQLEYYYIRKAKKEELMKNEMVEKKKRGRPIKIKIEAVEPKRPRGRPFRVIETTI